MLDIKKVFNSSYNLMMRNKRIIFPILCSFLIPLVLVFTFLQLSGLGSLLREFASLSQEFNQQKTTYLTNTENIGKQGYASELINYLGRDNSNSAYNSEFDKYLSDKGYNWNRYKELINSRNIALLAIFLLIMVIFSFYFGCMSQSMIALAIKKKDMTFGSILKVTHHFLFRYFGLQIAVSLIMGAPILLIAFVTGALAYFGILKPEISPLLGLLIGIIVTIGIFAFIIYFILASLRLFFATQSMFIDDQGIIASIKKSFQMTKGNLTQVILVSFVSYGIALFMNGLVSQPLQASVSGFLFQPSIAAMSINFVMICFFMLLQAVAATFRNAFLFYSYTNFKQDKSTK